MEFDVSFVEVTITKTDSYMKTYALAFEGQF
jgi:hypothetical protein